MPRTTANEFTDDQRAEIYARDRAVCAYSGRSLWLADVGAAPHAIDWIDHVRPVARGGGTTTDNGVTCSHLYNYQKRAGSGGVLLFHSGRPTADYFTFFHVVHSGLAEHLRRFEDLPPAYWYFNRALFHVLLGANTKKALRRDGSPLTRGVEYRAKAALRFLEVWASKSVGLPSLARRKLLPRRPGSDQRLLLSAAGGGQRSKAEAPDNRRWLPIHCRVGARSNSSLRYRTTPRPERLHELWRGILMSLTLSRRRSK